MTGREKADAIKEAMTDTVFPIAIKDGTAVAVLRATRVDFGQSSDPNDSTVYVRVFLEVACKDDPRIVTPN